MSRIALRWRLSAAVTGSVWAEAACSVTEMLNLEGRDFQIAGVLPLEQAIEGSYGLNQPEVFVQIGCDSQERPNSRGDMSFELIGRLRPGVTLGQANADLARVDQTLQKDYPNDYGDDSGCVQETAAGVSLH